MTARTGALVVQADVRMTLNGHSAHLTGKGQELRLTTDAPADLWAEVTRAELPAGWGRVNGPRAIGRVADQMADQGIALTVVGPTGELVRLGARVSSRLGRITTGSAAVHYGSPRTLAPTVVSVIRQSTSAILSRLRFPRRSR